MGEVLNGVAHFLLSSVNFPLRHFVQSRSGATDICMCRSIKTLFNFDPPATDDEVRAASLQFVRKLAGFTKPSKANEAAFDCAVERISAAARDLIDSLETTARPRDREAEAERLRLRSVQRFGPAVED